MKDRIIELLTYHPDEPMIFSTGLFLILFLGFSFIYMLLQRQLNLRLLFVTAFSYYFYYKSSGFYFCLLAVVTLSDYLIAHCIARHRSRWLVALSLIIDLGLLGYFKYTNFFVGMWTQMVGVNFQPWDIFLPVLRFLCVVLPSTGGWPHRSRKRFCTSDSKTNYGDKRYVCTWLLFHCYRSV